MHVRPLRNPTASFKFQRRPNGTLTVLVTPSSQSLTIRASRNLILLLSSPLRRRRPLDDVPLRVRLLANDGPNFLGAPLELGYGGLRLVTCT